MYNSKILLTGFAALVFCSAAFGLQDPTRPFSFDGPGSVPQYGEGFEGLTLNSILLSENRQVAIINGKALSIGDEVGAYEVIGIAADRVDVEGEEGPITLLLHAETRNMKRSQ